MNKLSTYLIFLLLLCQSCGFKLKPYDDDESNTPVSITRFDRVESRYLATGDYSALQQMSTDYPIETRTLIEKVLQIGPVDDPEISNKFLRFFQDSTLQTLISDVEAEYANMDDVSKELAESFDRLENMLPDLPRPNVYTQIGALDQSIVIGDKMIIIYLDKYMGENYPLYLKYFSYQQRTSMTRSYIVPDALCFYLLSLYPGKSMDRSTQLERDIHVGKVMWMVNKSVGYKVFDTRYVKMVDKYMRHNKNVTEKQLLLNVDHTKLKP